MYKFNISLSVKCIIKSKIMILAPCQLYCVLCALHCAHTVLRALHVYTERQGVRAKIYTGKDKFLSILKGVFFSLKALTLFVLLSKFSLLIQDICNFQLIFGSTLEQIWEKYIKKIYKKIYEKYMIILKRYLCVVLKSGRTFLGDLPTHNII